MPSTDQRQRGPQWSSRVSRALDITAAEPHRTGFFFDFDGTLAPIQENPETVQPAPEVMEPLARLVASVGRVGVVSARPVDFLRRHFAALPVTLYGLYGLESSRAGGDVVTEPAAVPWIPVIRDLTDQARAELPSGVLVEFKRLSVGLHFRSAPELGDAVQAWAERQAERLGLRLLEAGRMVVELKPPVQRDKGNVLTEEIGDLACGWYFGDDVADLAAFGALAQREVAGGFTGVRVAVANPETGNSVTGAANLVLDSPSAISALLIDVIAAIEQEGRAG